MIRIAALGVAAALVGCASQASPSVRDGDIVFQTSRSSQSAAIQRATHSPYSHMGLVLYRDGQPYVFEAIGPVKYTPLEDWVRRGDQGRFAIKRLRNADQVLTPAAMAKVRRAASELEGRPYDLAFSWSDDRIYCSELVWKIFDRALGVQVGTLQPLRTFDLSDPVVRAKLAERYGAHVPLEEPVISPAAMFESGVLESVASPQLGLGVGFGPRGGGVHPESPL